MELESNTYQTDTRTLVMICAWCKRLLRKDGTCWPGLVTPREMKGLEESNCVISHGICHACRDKVLRERG